MTSTYERAGLARNPFVADDPDFASALDRGIALPPQRFVQVIGERGSGKTTLLRTWSEQHGGTYYYVPQGIRRWQPVPVRRPIVYWDEADRLPRAMLRRAVDAAGLGAVQVVIGTHRSFPASGGLRSETATIRLGRLDPDVVHRWVAMKVACSSTDTVRSWAVLGEPPVEAVLAESATSWRAAGDAFHRWAAERVAAQP